MMHVFAGKQIRNAGAIGGNIMTGSPISDLIPILMATECQLEILSPGVFHEKREWVPFDGNFYTAYRRNILRPYQILGSLWIPFTKAHEYFYSSKQSRRHEDDIAIVNCGFKFNLNEDNNNPIILNCLLIFGGLGPTAKVMNKTMSFLNGSPWCKTTIDKAVDVLLSEAALPSNAPGGMTEYRQTLAGSLLLKGFISISLRMNIAPWVYRCWEIVLDWSDGTA